MVAEIQLGDKCSISEFSFGDHGREERDTIETNEGHRPILCKFWLV